MKRDGSICVPRIPWQEDAEYEQHFTATTARIVIRALAPKLTLRRLSVPVTDTGTDAREVLRLQLGRDLVRNAIMNLSRHWMERARILPT